jgi:serine/threonine protein kinase/WD40 repeat protein
MLCSKCNHVNLDGSQVCSACGAALEAAMLGTLNVGDGSIFAPLTPSQVNDAVDPGTSETLDSQDAYRDPFAKGQADNLEPSAPTAHLAEGTIVFENKDAESGTSGTIDYSDSILREALGISGGSGGTGGLQRVWEQAIGSSGKESGQSLRYDTPEASDSIFSRVSVRTVADANAPGSDKADYQIQDKIGAGAMGVVFSANQTAVNRLVAIKTIKNERSKDHNSRRQFFYEAVITADLDHPNIPPIYELGATRDGVVFYSMKLIRGSEWLKSIKKESVEGNLKVFEKVADAIGFAHSKNIIHRDLKPENVVIGAYGEVYVTDWGLGVNISNKPSVTFGGTPEYMAPEMANNRRRDIGKHSDIYLLGALLYQILTGRPPHTGASAQERLISAAKNEITPTTSTDPLIDVARKALSTQPEDRYATVADMQAAIREILKHNDSIELTNRSAELVQTATATKDYDTFNRAIFGYRDAIDLWSDNDAAKSGLGSARLAYGQCAFDQGNYDLALQTLDETVPAEAQLYSKAKSAKVAVEQRERRFKTLRNVFTAAVLLFAVVLGGAAWYANKQKGIAEERTIVANDALENEKKATIAESKAREAEKLANIEVKTKNEALEKNAVLIKGQLDTITGQNEALIQKQEEIAKANENLDASNKSLSQKTIDLQASEASLKNALVDVQRSFAQLKLSSFGQSIGLALDQAEQANAIGAASALNQIIQTPDAASGLFPKSDSWATKRIGMLANTDVAKQPIGAAVAALSFSQTNNIGIAGNANGEIIKLKYENGKLATDDSVKPQKLGSKIEAVSVSPDGSEALIAAKTNEASYELYQWNFATDAAPKRVAETGNRSFQGFGYSPDGKTALAGINGGVWFRSADGTWSSLARSIRGSLVNIGWLDNNQAIALIAFENKNYLFALDAKNLTANAGAAISIALPTELDGKLTSIAPMSNNQIIVGTSEGNLATYALRNNQLADRREFEKKHRAAIDQIVASGSGSFISRSKEPVVHVWKTDSSNQLVYDTFIPGAPGQGAAGNNIAGATFINCNTLVSVDDSGNAAALNVDRQKLRRVITRQSGDAKAEYPVPVVGVHTRGTSSQVISIDANGVADLWNLQDGQTQNMDSRWVYVGHTPGATIVDSAIDLEAGIIITVASLTSAERRYLTTPNHNDEYCFWDYDSGNMIKRWTDAGDASSRPRLSLIEAGKVLSFGAKSMAIDYSSIRNGGDLQFPLPESLASKTPGFSIANPVDKSVVAMVNPSGKLLLWNADGKSEPSNAGEKGQVPMRGAWSSDGRRLYLAFNNGNVFKFTYAEGRFGEPEFIAKLSLGDLSLVLTHHEMDMSVDAVQGNDRVFVATRSTRNTTLASMEVTSEGKVISQDTQAVAGVKWFDIKSKSLSGQFAAKVVTTANVGDHFFVTSRTEGVFDIGEDGKIVDFFGRPALVGTTADQAGEHVWSLHADGTIYRLDIDDQGNGQWQRAEKLDATGIKQIGVSLSGKKLAMLSDTGLNIVNAETGDSIDSIDAALAFAWQPTASASNFDPLAILLSDGSLKLIDMESPNAMSIAADFTKMKVRSLQFYSEYWGDKSESRYLTVQLDPIDVTQKQGELHFVALDAPKNAADASAAEESEKPTNFVAPIDAGALLATSSVDSILVTGDGTGTVRIWYAYPTYEMLNPLYDVSTEKDTAIRSVSFADGGSTLIATDDKSRLYGWLSEDKLQPK